jgi:hypothetical protein
VLRIGANISLLGRSIPIAIGMFGFVCGQAEIGLFTTGIPTPFPSTARQLLLALLLARAKTHGECAGANAPGTSAAYVQ